MKAVLTLLVVCVWLMLMQSIHSKEAQTIEIDNAIRSILLKNSIVRETTVLTLKNVGTTSQSSFIYVIPEARRVQLSYILAQQQKEKLNVVQKDNEYTITLSKSLTPKSSVTVTVQTAFVNSLAPYPKEIRQHETQKFKYEDSATIYSPYKVKYQKTSYKLPGHSVEGYTKKSASLKGSELTYGPFKNMPRFTNTPIYVHFPNNMPFIRIKQLKRILEISHWGNLAVEEHYVIQHHGAKLKGGFSRLDYTRRSRDGRMVNGAPSSWRQLTAKLPPRASDVYFRDRIGNISTSTCRPSGNNLLVDFFPRFPMLGGWQTTFYIGYNVPLEDVMTADGSTYKLTYEFSTPFSNAHIDEYTLEVNVPEGAVDIKTDIPFDVDNIEHDKLYTYLDIYGRPVVRITKQNAVIPEHNEPFSLSYTFVNSLVWQEPLMIIATLFFICVSTMVYVRFDLKITKTDYEVKSEYKDLRADLAEKFTEKVVSLEDNVYRPLENAIKHKLSNTERIDEFNQQYDTIKGTFKKIVEEMKAIETSIDNARVEAKLDQKQDVILAKLHSIYTTTESKFDKSRQIINHKQAKTPTKMNKLEQEYDSLSTSILTQIGELNLLL